MFEFVKHFIDEDFVEETQFESEDIQSVVRQLFFRLGVPSHSSYCLSAVETIFNSVKKVIKNSH